MRRAAQSPSRTIKRCFDIFVAGIATVALSPLCLLTAILIAVDDGLPVLYRQTRVGLHGREFQMLKFRSMRKGADRAGSHITSEGDPRITRLGRVIRRFSLDEMPQLLNVLRGEMSIVGPRPDVPAQRALYSDEDWRLRSHVRPGITGLAQARYRSDASVSERLEADLCYVQNHSLALDLKIIWWTLSRLTGRGAN